MYVYPYNIEVNNKVSIYTYIYTHTDSYLDLEGRPERQEQKGLVSTGLGAFAI